MPRPVPAACLEPPEGTGDLNMRALWPQAFAPGGGGKADVEAALRVYLTEGWALGAAQADDTKRASGAQQWARWRAMKAHYDRSMASALSVSTNDGYSASMTVEQLQALLGDALAAKQSALGFFAVAATAAPVSRSSYASDMVRRW